MKYLYLDNIRGFTDTFIPLKDVNFLVGENSTGKTSVLGILNLISSPRFWFSQDFGSSDYSFGNFEDIVSVFSENQDSFSIGFIEKNFDNNKKNSFKSFLIKFIEVDGLPSVKNYCYIKGTSEGKIKFINGEIYYQINDLSSYSDIEDFKDSVFRGWLNANDNEISKYKSIGKNNFSFFQSGSLILIPSIFQKGYTFKKDLIPEDIKIASEIMPNITDNLVWFAPIRMKPKKTYDEYKIEFNPEGSHTPFLLKKFLSNKKISEKFRLKLKKIGQESGLFDDISIKKYGDGVSDPFELRVELNRKQINISHVGYGVSQSLPIIIEIFLRTHGKWFTIQQPEVHLHPKAQSALGEMIFESFIYDKKSFLVETHSDYIIDRFRMQYKKNKKDIPDSQILFFSRNQKGNKVVPIEIYKDGKISDEQPDEYRDFFIKESLEILKI